MRNNQIEISAKISQRFVAIFLFWILGSGWGFSECGQVLQSLRSTRNPTPRKVISLFKKSFSDNYLADECFENTIRFLETAIPMNKNQLFLISIENRGASTLGMVQAKRARGKSYRKKGPGWEEYPDTVEKKWNHHVFAMDGNSRVFDFDYTHQPKVEDLRSYLMKMFLDEPTELREKKLDDYQMTIIRAEFAIRTEADPNKRVMTLREFLKAAF